MPLAQGMKGWLPRIGSQILGIDTADMVRASTPAALKAVSRARQFMTVASMPIRISTGPADQPAALILAPRMILPPPITRAIWKPEAAHSAMSLARTERIGDAANTHRRSQSLTRQFHQNTLKDVIRQPLFSGYGMLCRRGQEAIKKARLTGLFQNLLLHPTILFRIFDLPLTAAGFATAIILEAAIMFRILDAALA